MTRKKKWILITTAVIAVAALATAVVLLINHFSQKDEYTSGDFVYAVRRDNGEAVLLRYTGAVWPIYALDGGDRQQLWFESRDSSVVLPDAFDGHPLTAVQGNPFLRTSNDGAAEYAVACRLIVPESHPYLAYDNGLLYGKTDGRLICCTPVNRGRLEIPPQITNIGQDAFRGCNQLTEVVIPEGVYSIGHGAFRDCTSLRSVSIPSTVANIGDYAFLNCRNLAGAVIPDEASLGQHVFELKVDDGYALIPDLTVVRRSEVCEPSAEVENINVAPAAAEDETIGTADDVETPAPGEELDAAEDEVPAEAAVSVEVAWNEDESSEPAEDEAPAWYTESVEVAWTEDESSEPAEAEETAWYAGSVEVAWTVDESSEPAEAKEPAKEAFDEFIAGVIDEEAETEAAGDESHEVVEVTEEAVVEAAEDVGCEVVEATEEAAVEAAEDVSREAVEETGELSGKTVILHSNDVHGAIDGYAYMAALKAEYEAKGAKVIAVDAGDYSQGTVYVSSSKGAAAVDMMNAAGYDIATLGNHEFDFGYAQLEENLASAKFAVICADVVDDAMGETIYPATIVVDGDVKIGFFGLATPETATKVNPGLISEISFRTFDDLYVSAQEAIDSIRDEADIVIGLVHLGVDDESAANGYRSVDLYSKVTGVDFLIDGHSHTVMTSGAKGEPIQSTGTAFEYIGVVVIDNATKTIEDHYLVKTRPLYDGETLPEGVKIIGGEAEMAKDEAVAAKAAEITDAVDAAYNTAFAVTDVVLNGERAPGNRTEETNLGDLITDAMVWSVVKDGGIENAEPFNVVGITNGGGIRATINAGEVTKKDINTVLPFGNTVAVIYVKGSELLEALEASTFCTPDAIGGYPQTSGIDWTLNTAKEYDQGALYVVGGKEMVYYAPASIRRVTINSVNGMPFDPDATYAVVTNNFCAAGGDTYAVFNRAYEEGSGFDTGIPMDEAVMAYVEEVLNGRITAEAYGEPRGSAKQVTEAEEAAAIEEPIEEAEVIEEVVAEEPAEEEAAAIEEPVEETEVIGEVAAEEPAVEEAAAVEEPVEEVEVIEEVAAEKPAVEEAAVPEVTEAAEAISGYRAEAFSMVAEYRDLIVKLLGNASD